MNLSTKAVIAAQEMLSGEAGLKVSVEQVQAELGQLGSEASFRIDADYWAAKMVERIPPNRDPKISVALIKLARGQKEKLAGYAATATMELELSLTHERADKLRSLTGIYLDALSDVLNRNQGLWSSGVYFAGGFAIEIAPVSKGGLNYVQSATVKFEINLWQD
jgi:hypothetical protein